MPKRRLLCGFLEEIGGGGGPTSILTCLGTYADRCKNAAIHFGDRFGVRVDQSFLKFNATARQRWHTYVIAIQFGAYLGHLFNTESGFWLQTVLGRSGPPSPSPAQKTKMVWRISTGRATAALCAFTGKANGDLERALPLRSLRLRVGGFG